ncbi:hypothetical protein BIY24_08185 [Halobacteriovorax marinus]|uniref:Dihydrodipicolinate reductase n=1 Tax=Halobacteriovorax marinus (strain ATCC BAA-682 / DSM 15412 / SJ) TaxID=862908 RepID=E1X1I0_HALMS|nr:dihydrodipicolinate reductase C-terminal domain-containing protein [Halobacteriovorax marinus]ATH07929.1 hypothetical protein BIY24_08185 [Halobacteriovorax marinus]CBW26571.1 putative dihydrodipicolinate reductase [Halobacteriovorax marinus SJ]
MKYAIIGNGKTGSYVSKILSERQCSFEIFNSTNKPTRENLRDFDVAICFIDGEVFKSLIPELLESDIDIVTGATGLDWSDDIRNAVIEKKRKWIKASNFSIGMNLVHKMISESFSKAQDLFENYTMNIHEVHHTKKLDAPSGTALKWQEWSKQEMPITSERIGDVVGDHIIELKTDNEIITLRHQATDRSIFASGAIKACEYFSELSVGLYDFEDLTLSKLLK